jgi:hypothetical protein
VDNHLEPFFGIFHENNEFHFETAGRLRRQTFQKDTSPPPKTPKTGEKGAHFTPNRLGTDIAYYRAKQNK